MGITDLAKSLIACQAMARLDGAPCHLRDGGATCALREQAGPASVKPSALPVDGREKYKIKSNKISVDNPWLSQA